MPQPARITASASMPERVAAGPAGGWDAELSLEFLNGRDRTILSGLQTLTVHRGGQLALHERLALDAGSPAMTAAWGLAGHTVCATFIAVMPDATDPGAARRAAHAR